MHTQTGSESTQLRRRSTDAKALDPSIIAGKLKELQGEMSNAEMAESLGVDKERFQKWRTGGVVVPLEFGVLLADRYGVTLDCLYRGAGLQNVTGEEMELLENYRRCPEITRAVIQGQAVLCKVRN